jgi:hypothetical protein
MPYSQLSVALPQDLNNRKFVGPAGKVFKGIADPGNADEASAYVAIIGPDGTTPLVTVKGVYIHGATAHDSALSSQNPIIIGGKAKSAPAAVSAANDAVEAFFDLLGLLGITPRDAATGAILFPTAQAPVHNIGSQNLTRIMTVPQVYNSGSGNWDLMRGDSTNGVLVNITKRTREALTASSPTAATVGTGSAQAVATNSNRKGLVLTNTSVNTISLGLGATAVLNSGITLLPGSVFVMDEYTFSTAAINAIASAAASNLAIQEYT